MSKELIGINSTSNVNIFGLRAGQAHLYKYILKCTEEGTKVDLHEVALIYYTHTKLVERVYTHHDKEGWHYRKENALQHYNMRRAKDPNNNYVYLDAKMWLKGCLGSFVLRGLLAVVPKFNPEQVKEDG